MGALLGLLELLRVAEEHDVPGRAADCEDVCERHLTRLVHEEVVERLYRSFCRP
jgi:hypothetical protein